MNHECMLSVLQKIKEYDRIILTRHVRPDGDAIGATKGLARILELSFPEKEVYVLNEDSSEHMAFLGGESEPIPDEAYHNALCIVMDTGNLERISNKKYTLCKELIKIDHHIDNAPYGDVSWVESHRSSVCEMVVAFYAAFPGELKLDKQAAEYLYTGLVTDSGWFRFSSVSGETMRLAGILLDCGIDTDVIAAHLTLTDFSMLKYKAEVYEKMRITENGVAYVFIDLSMQKKYGLSREDAGEAVTFMESLKGCLCWIAFIEVGDKDHSIRARMRSRFAAINSIAEKYRGGGHACASGATVYSEEELAALVAETDALIKEYKKTHEGWL